MTSPPEMMSTASNLQTWWHMPQVMHFSPSMTCCIFFSPLIAPTGHCFPQAMHPVQLLLISYRISGLQTPAGHFRSLMWATYSSRKYLMVEVTGFGALLPSARPRLFLRAHAKPILAA